MAPIAASGVWFDMSVEIPTLGFETVASPAVSSPKGKKPSAKKTSNGPQPLSPSVQEAILAAKVNADIGNDIRWDIIMQEIAEVAPAAPRHITPMPKVVVPLKLPIKMTREDSTSAGESTDSELSTSDADSPTAAFRAPPGLSLPPGLAAPKCMPPPGLCAPPGLDDVHPPPGFESFPALSATPQKTTTLPPWRKAKGKAAFKSA